VLFKGLSYLCIILTKCDKLLLNYYFNIALLHNNFYASFTSTNKNFVIKPLPHQKRIIFIVGPFFFVDISKANVNQRSKALCQSKIGMRLFSFPCKRKAVDCFSLGNHGHLSGDNHARSACMQGRSP